MVKRSRIEEAESQLPEAIIQHIQSFLDGKKAAQTTLLSRSWYNAWLTRPNLDFDNIGFPELEFWEFVNKTMERYEKLNLKIDSLRLWIRTGNPLVNGLIIKALKMGATALDFKIYALNEFALSNQVFGFKNLTSLSLRRCRIADDEKLLISCSKLKSLSLNSQSNVIWDIISSCPLIENFSLFTPETERYISSPFTEFGNRIVNEFHNLKRLVLFRVIVDASCFDDFSSKFPCLKELFIHYCRGTDTHISSPSLEYIVFTSYNTMRRAKFDVPRIRRFTFSGSNIPRLLSFKTTSNCNWESHISIQRRRPPNASWFLSLSRLLKKLSLSKVSLGISSEKPPSECAAKFQGLRNKPRVEELRITGPYSVCPAIFYYLFKCCRPIYVDHNWFPKQFDFMEFVTKRMMQQVSLNSCIAYQRMCADLEEVNVEFYDESVSAWRTSTSVGADDDEHKIRLHLTWGN